MKRIHTILACAGAILLNIGMAIDPTKLPDEWSHIGSIILTILTALGPKIQHKDK